MKLDKTKPFNAIHSPFFFSFSIHESSKIINED